MIGRVNHLYIYVFNGLHCQKFILFCSLKCKKSLVIDNVLLRYESEILDNFVLKGNRRGWFSLHMGWTIFLSPMSNDWAWQLVLTPTWHSVFKPSLGAAVQWFWCRQSDQEHFWRFDIPPTLAILMQGLSAAKIIFTFWPDKTVATGKWSG